MDVHVFYFHEEKQQIVRSYIGSHFWVMLMQKRHFNQNKSIFGKLDWTCNLVLVSIDGPNVNWKTEIIKGISRAQ